jgi:hypothetical protein
LAELVGSEQVPRLAEIVARFAEQPSLERIYLLPGRAQPRAEATRFELLVVVEDGAVPRWRSPPALQGPIAGAGPSVITYGSTDFQSALQREQSLAATAVEHGALLYARPPSKP